MTTTGSSAADAVVLGLDRVHQNRMPESSRKPRRSRDENRRRFEEAVDLYLESCYARPTAVSVKEFAVFLQRTQPYLSRIAPRLIGMSVRSFLRTRQLAHAAELLRRTPATVTILQVAISSGFGTPWTLTRAFREAFGITPAKYREQCDRRRN